MEKGIPRSKDIEILALTVMETEKCGLKREVVLLGYFC